jgi:hypothetical protein
VSPNARPRRRLLIPLVVATLALSSAPATARPLGSSPQAPGDDGGAPLSKCESIRPNRWRAAHGVTDPRGDLRVFGIQYKQVIENVQTYGTFRRAMRCLVKDFVLPYREPGRPTLVVFPEDVGLMTLAIGERGRAARGLAETQVGGTRAGAPAGDQAPVGAAAGLQVLAAAYGPQVAAYRALYPDADPRKQLFLAATDTMVRAVNVTFSDIARDYGLYVVASNNQATYRESHDPVEVATFSDPEVDDGTAYVATTSRVTNNTWLWGPDDIRPDAADGQRNLLFRNEKVPLTPIEQDLLALDPGPTTGPAARRNAAGVKVAGFRLGFATSLPAFTYGTSFGRDTDEPCADVSRTYMHCMDHLGVDVVVQAEANSVRWAGPGGRSTWQPLEWMDSTWRAVADPAVHFRYNITPHLVGNVFDIAFDGQSAITERGYDGKRRHYVGNARALDEDEQRWHRYAGGKREFLVLAPWVRKDGPREALRARGAELAPGSGSERENDYLQTAVYADLVRKGHR